MKLNKTILIITFLVGLIILNNIYAQGRVYDGPDDPEGDIAAIRVGVMNGNRVLLSFKNTTRLGDWPSPSASRWPNDNTGSYMVDGLAVLIGGMVFLEQDTIPVTDAAKIAARNNYDTLWYVQTSYAKQLMDQNSKGTVDWGLYPVFGYFNELQDYAAMSNQSVTWPVNGWPASGSTKKWPGEWNGRFGRGIKYAALETYFVANDAQDQEYLQPNLTVKYYPRPGLKIGDKLPDVTIQKGMPWGGLGLRVEVRGFQWNNPQTRDAIFWEYNISNISDYDLPRIAFGAWLDNGIGGGPTDDFDDVGFYDKYEDLAYSWDMNATAVNGLVPGVMGWAFLESPGIQNDNIDNDDDGITDEKRDNDALVKADKLSGITDINKFLKWYHIEESDLKEHWDADEDQDWRDGEDTNENGVYDTDEDTGDDVGLDGVGPNDLNYNGPDEGECNHKPDYKEGVGCEPNFAATDIDESDMIGLTSFRMFIHPQGWSPSASFDKDCWNVFASDSLIEYFGTPTNLIEMFGSGQFRLDKGRTERFSLAEVHAYEDLSSLSTTKHTAPSLYSKKAIVQTIYESDYRFAQAPVLPTLSAQALDGKVILTWNDVADKLTREPLLRGENDFEGYKLYKATDKKFGDAELLYDGYGNPAGKKALYQCDLVDGKSGFAEFSLFNGLAFYLGDETGIKHYYIDENVQNGRTYYYALVAYDYGIEVFGKDSASVLPSENDAILDLTEDEAIRFVGQNVQIVTPHQTALGYVPESFEITEGRELFDLCGTITPTILNSAKLKNGSKYKVKFSIKELGHLRSPSYRHPTDINYTTNGFYIYDVAENDTLIYSETSDNFQEDNFVSKDILNNGTSVWCLNEDGVKSDLFDGMQLSIENTSPQSKINIGATGWITGKADISVVPSVMESRYFPWQYDIVFSNEPYASITTYAGSIKSISGKLVSSSSILLNQSFNFYVQNKSFPDANGNYEKLDLIVQDVNQNGVFDKDVDTVLVGNTVKIDTRVFWSGTVLGINFGRIASGSDMPKANDVYRVNFTRPYYANDSVSFTIKEPVDVVASEIKQNLNRIKVVPNPYIATNMMEEAVSNPYLSQRRQLLFTHLPAECTIKIFTTSGVLVRELIVENSADDGTAHWDMLTKEGLEIAAGIYIYHVKAKVTGDEIIGKFAVVK